MRTVSVLLLLVLCLSFAPSAADAAPLQRQWLHNLVAALGWSYGLPDEPEDADYLHILSGNREFRFQAESVVDPEDVVNIRKLRNFGPFEGEGWVGGISGPTTAHLRFLLPVGGSYRLTAGLLGDGHRFRLGNQQTEADGGRRFTTVAVGEFLLAAGERTVEDLLPPGGGLDFIALSAPPLAAIEPRDGWAPDAPLTRDDLAVTTARLFDLEGLLPPSGETRVIEAEGAPHQPGAGVTAARFLGEPSGGRWLRAGAVETVFELPFTVPRGGAYRLSLRVVGNAPVTGVLDGRSPITVAAGPALAEAPAGIHYLAAGEHTLELTLPARGGVDSLHLRPLASEPGDYLRLAGLADSTEAPSEAEIDRLLRLLAAIGSPR